MVERGTASPSSHSIPTQGVIRHVLQKKAGIYPMYKKSHSNSTPNLWLQKTKPELYSYVLRDIKKKTQKTQKPKCSETIARSFVFVCLMVVCV